MRITDVKTHVLSTPRADELDQRRAVGAQSVDADVWECKGVGWVALTGERRLLSLAH
jgi:hypothetical protein